MCQVERGRRTLARKSDLAPRSAWPSEGEVLAPSASESGEELRMGAKRRREASVGIWDAPTRRTSRCSRSDISPSTSDISPSTCEISCEISEASETSPSDAHDWRSSRDWREVLRVAPLEVLLPIGERRDAPNSCEIPLGPAPLGALSSRGTAVSAESPPLHCWGGWGRRGELGMCTSIWHCSTEQRAMHQGMHYREDDATHLRQ